MNAHKRLERQLRASVARAGAQPLVSRLRLGLWSRGLPVLVIAVTTTAVATAAVTLVLTEPRNPGPVPHNVDDQAVVSAWNTAWAEDPTCNPASASSTRTNTSTATPSKEMRSMLPVLRRPATSADRLPSRVYHGGRLWLPEIGTGAVYVRYVRRARVADGTTFYLVPVDKLGRPPLSAAAASHCYELTVAALQAELPTVPAKERAATRRYGDAEFAVGRYNLATSNVHEGVFLLAERAQEGGGAGGQSPATIRKTGLLSYLSPPAIWYGVVPRGVATVSLQFAAGNRGTHHARAFTVTGNVVNNVFVMSASGRSELQTWPARAIWRSASGTVIKIVNERPFHP